MESASTPVTSASGKWANRSYYFDALGRERASYDKVHMFDVELASGESWRESNAYEPGREVVTIEETPVGRLGLAICYDMRFPALFEALGNRRCDAIAIPAAFTGLQNYVWLEKDSTEAQLISLLNDGDTSGYWMQARFEPWSGQGSLRTRAGAIDHRKDD